MLDAIKEQLNYTITENGALSHASTLNAVYDLFALGGAYRSRSDEDCIDLFFNAYNQDPVYALKCLFYLRDAREGQGERRFFRVVTRWLASYDAPAMRRNLEQVPFYGRWDDLLVFIGTLLEKDAFALIRHQLALDVETEHPSLCAKWMPSINASSAQTRRNANLLREYLGLTAKEYRKLLSVLRKRINILETQMSEQNWGDIEFDKLPSQAGFRHRKAFIRHDEERMQQNPNAMSYADFIASKETKVNAGVLYPYQAVSAAREASQDECEVANKYWDNLTDYFNGATFNGLAVVDTSGSMSWTKTGGAYPIDVAISLGMYCAERAKGPFHGHYISFASRPQLIEIKGKDFSNKVKNIYRTNLCDNTNIAAVFDLLLEVAKSNKLSQEDMPENIVIVSDMEFDPYFLGTSTTFPHTMMGIRFKWKESGYELPKLIYWNVNARHNLIAESPDVGATFVSGMSPVIFRSIMTGKSNLDLMFEILNSQRYESIK